MLSPIEIAVRVISKRIENLKKEPDEMQNFYRRQSIRHFAEIVVECIEDELVETRGARGEELAHVKYMRRLKRDIEKQIEQMNTKAERGINRH